MSNQNEKTSAALRKFRLSHHPRRPTVQYYIENIFDDFIEMHGDRAFGDDKAIVTGIALLDNTPVTVIGNIRGNGIEENVECNFAMAHPEGYRKALRQMRLAEKFSRPIITFVDTPGAYCGVAAEERGQGQAIADNLYNMMALSVPIISVITGEGGSGGALGIACANRLFMLENSTFSVISPRGCASILWKDPEREADAAEMLKITADELLKLNIISGIIPEPDGGAQNDPLLTAKSIKSTIVENLMPLMQLSRDQLRLQRYAAIRRIGIYNDAKRADNQEKKGLLHND